MSKPTNVTQADKKYNASIAGVWRTKNGNYMGMRIDERTLEALGKVTLGGKLFIKILPDEFRKSETSPNGYLEFISKEDVDSYAPTAQTRFKNEDESDF